MDENLSSAVSEVFVPAATAEGLIYRGNYMVNWCRGHETSDLRSGRAARRGGGEVVEIVIR